MASHRMLDSDRPRRPVPAWVTAPPVDEVAPVAQVADTGLEARPTPAPTHAAHAAPVPTTAVVSSAVPASIASLVEADASAPDYPPQEDLLPPAPMSPNVHTVPFENPAAPPAAITPGAALAMPVSPVTAGPAAAPEPTTGDAAGTPADGAVIPAPAAVVPAVPVEPAVVAQSARPAPTAAPVVPAPPVPPAAPIAPGAGQPRFSVPGLEHVVVEGTEPEPVGPIGYRTPRRFAHQRAAKPAPTPPTRSFDAVLHAAPSASAAPTAPDATRPPVAPVAPSVTPDVSAGADPGLPTEAIEQPTSAATPDRRPLVGVTPGAVLGAVAGAATIGLAAWWFTAPATVHGVGLVLGVLALVLSIATVRNPLATWQRRVGLLGAVLGGVGTLVLLWAVAAALLPLAGVTLPDLTGTGTTPTLVP